VHRIALAFLTASWHKIRNIWQKRVGIRMQDRPVDFSSAVIFVVKQHLLYFT